MAWIFPDKQQKPLGSGVLAAVTFVGDETGGSGKGGVAGVRVGVGGDGKEAGWGLRAEAVGSECLSGGEGVETGRAVQGLGD